jgi:hypothetical protein
MSDRNREQAHSYSCFGCTERSAAVGDYADEDKDYQQDWRQAVVVELAQTLDNPRCGVDQRCAAADHAEQRHQRHAQGAGDAAQALLDPAFEVGAEQHQQAAVQRETVASRSSIKSMRFPLALKSVQKLLQQVVEKQLSALGGRQT